MSRPAGHKQEQGLVHKEKGGRREVKNRTVKERAASQSQWGVHLLGLGILLAGCSAHAVDYSFPNKLPLGCVKSAANYNCVGLTLLSGDTIATPPGKPTLIIVNGPFTAGEFCKLNDGHYATDLALVVTGVTDIGAGTSMSLNLTGGGIVTTGSNTQITGSIATIAGVVTLGSNNTMTGNIKTESAAVNVGAHSSITGDITTTIAGVVTIGANSSLIGNITTTAGAINIGASNHVVGNIVTIVAGAITIGSDANIVGQVSTTYLGSEVGAGAITVGANGNLSGNVTTNAGAITTGDKTKVVGGITTNTGAITVGNAANVGESVCTGLAGAVTIGSNSKVGGNIVTSAGAITVGDKSTVSGALLTKGAGAISTASSSTIGTALNAFKCASAPPRPTDSADTRLGIKTRQWRQIFMR